MPTNTPWDKGSYIGKSKLKSEEIAHTFSGSNCNVTWSDE